MASGFPYQWLIILTIVSIFCLIIFLFKEQKHLLNANKQLEPELKKQLEAEIRRQLEAEIRKELEAELKKDMLTNADSRRQGTADLTKAFNEFQSEGVNPVIVMFDIDNLKHINDTHGHEVGDQVLKEIVNTVYKTIRTTDKLIRWGGDEFVGIFYGVTEHNAAVFTGKIDGAVSALEIPAGDGRISPAVSIGVSCFKESDSDFSDVIKRTDQAMYKSKADKQNTNGKK